MQWRNFQISDGKIPVDEIDDDIEDMLFDDDEFENVSTSESTEADYNTPETVLRTPDLDNSEQKKPVSADFF